MEETLPPAAPSQSGVVDTQDTALTLSSEEESGLEIARKCLAEQSLDVKSALDSVKGEKGKAELEMLYGETPLESVVQALYAVNESLDAEMKLKFDGTETFLDLGAGRGHVVMGAAATKQWKKCAGIEMVEKYVGEFNKAKDYLSKLEQADQAANFATSSSQLEMMCADIVENEAVVPLLEEADLVYCFDLAFPEMLRRQVAYILNEFLRDGALVVSTHLDRFPSANFVKIGSMFSVQMEWGAAPAQLYRKMPGSFEPWLAHHESQLKAYGIPRELWESASLKLIEQRIDIGAFVELAQLEGSNEFVVVTQNELKANSHVFLLDHCFSFASKQDFAVSLAQVPGLRERLLALRPHEEIKVDDTNNPDNSDLVLKAIEPLLASYTMVEDPSKPEEQATTYYVLDEVGSRIRRSYSGVAADLQEGPANFRIVPIYSFDQRLAFSLGYPIIDIPAGSFLCADHEQGWTSSTDVLSQIQEKPQGVMLPEMKEFAAKSQLQEMIAKSD